MEYDPRPGQGSYTGYHSDARRTADGYRSIGRLFRRHRIAVPAGFLVAGAVPLVLFITTLPEGKSPQDAGLIIGPLMLFILVGLATLPFGIKSYLNERAHPMVLTCPKCLRESRDASNPFSVQRWSDVEYANVVCSYCGRDFTVPRTARLI